MWYSWYILIRSAFLLLSGLTTVTFAATNTSVGASAALFGGKPWAFCLKICLHILASWFYEAATACLLDCWLPCFSVQTPFECVLCEAGLVCCLQDYSRLSVAAIRWSLTPIRKAHFATSTSPLWSLQKAPAPQPPPPLLPLPQTAIAKALPLSHRPQACRRLNKPQTYTAF